MRIGIDIRSLSAKKQTGIDEYIYNLLSKLFEVSKEDEFFLLYNSYSAGIPSKIQKWRAHSNVKIIEFHWPSKILNFLLWFLRFPKLDKMIGGVDVFFLPNITFSSVSKSVPLVTTFHDLSFEIFPGFFNFKRKLWHSLVNPKKIAKRSKKIIAVSSSTSDDIRKIYKINKNKIKVIPLGLSNVFLEERRINQKQTREKYSIPLDVPFILYLGTIEPRKNIPFLIKSFNQFKKNTGLPHILVIAGSMGWSYTEVTEYISKSPYNKDMVLSGPVKDLDRLDLYSMAEVFIFPSYFEGFGLPPLEAMSCGTPVILSASTSLIENFGDNALLINPHKVEELSWAINKILEDEEYREYLSKNGKAFAREFNWENTAKETIAVLHEARK